MNRQLKLFFDKLEREKKDLSMQYEQANHHLQSEQDQLRQLQQYEVECGHNIGSQLGHQQVNMLTRYREFYHKIHDLVATQQEKIVLAQSHCTNLAKALAMLQKKMDMLSDFSARKDQETNHELEKKLQKEIDDLMLRQWQRPKA